MANTRKFYCTEYSEAVEHKDCLNCLKWDDCPDREQGIMLAYLAIWIVVLLIILGIIFFN